MYAQEIAHITPSDTVPCDYNYTCGCDILPEELGGCDEQKLLRVTMHTIIADHELLDKCSRCSVFLPPSLM